MNAQITITQEQLRALHNSISACSEYLRANDTGSHADIYLGNQLDLAHKACAYMGHELYKAWSELPDGTPLKEIYRDDVWHPEPDATNNDDT